MICHTRCTFDGVCEEMTRNEGEFCSGRALDWYCHFKRNIVQRRKYITSIVGDDSVVGSLYSPASLLRLSTTFNSTLVATKDIAAVKGMQLCDSVSA